MGIFNDNMYSEEEVKRIKEIYLDVGWLIRDFEVLPPCLQKSWSHEYATFLHCFEDYEFKIIARELTEYFQDNGYNYKVEYRKTDSFNELYAVEVKKEDG